MKYTLSKTMGKVTVTRRGKKKRDQPSSPNAIEDVGFGGPAAAICDAPPNTQLSFAPNLSDDTLTLNRGITYFLTDI